MMNWFNRLISKRREETRHKQQIWQIWVDDNIYLRMPYRIHSSKQNWIIWGKMQAKIFSHFQQYWQETHTYLWYRTNLPEQITRFIDSEQFRKMPATIKREHAFIFPDCQDQHVLEIVLATGTLFHLSRAIFILDRKPLNWEEVIVSLLGITKKLSKGSTITEFERELSICRCLCYSVDNDLVIAKVDLPISTVLSILNDIASEESFELVIQRQALKK